MIDFPFCKINLGLHVLRKRADGYHDIETCFYPVPWNDVLEIIPSDATELSVTGLEIPGGLGNNIILKAYNLLKKDFDLKPVKIHLHKIIPHGAGLGGGSSDGAHTFKLLNRIFKLNLSSSELSTYALKLGSDCPFFVETSPMIATGRGELLNPISLSLTGINLVIVKPQISVSTAEAYADVTSSNAKNTLEPVLLSPIDTWKTLLKNDFEESVFRKYPEISGIKDKLYELGAKYASMSGSGSAVFGLFENGILNNDFFGESMVWQTKL